MAERELAPPPRGGTRGAAARWRALGRALGGRWARRLAGRMAAGQLRLAVALAAVLLPLQATVLAQAVDGTTVPATALGRLCLLGLPSALGLMWPVVAAVAGLGLGLQLGSAAAPVVAQLAGARAAWLVVTPTLVATASSLALAGGLWRWEAPAIARLQRELVALGQAAALARIAAGQPLLASERLTVVAGGREQGAAGQAPRLRALWLRQRPAGGRETQALVADWAELGAGEDGQLRLTLGPGSVWQEREQVPLGGLATFAAGELTVPVGIGSGGGRQPFVAAQALAGPELVALAGRAATPSARAQALIVRARRLAQPLAAPGAALLGLGLGLSCHRRRGLAWAVVLAGSVALVQAGRALELISRAGRLAPAAAAWLPVAGLSLAALAWLGWRWRR